MRATKNSTSSWFLLLAFFVLTLVNGTGAVAQEKILYNFGSRTNDGAQPLAGLIFDSAGNLYGTTSGGGASGQGAVFELSPAKSGSWFENVLFSFHTIRPGVAPAAGLVMDSSGNLYGTARLSGIFGKGVVFELKHWPSGGWSEIVLHSFGAAGDGSYPVAGLIFDAAGNLYGATDNGGPKANASGGGTVFELSPTTGGTWTEKILHSFSGPGPDGFGPDAALIFDSAGNLYGTTVGGGTHNHGGSGGTMFELSPTSSGEWTETILHDCIGNGTDANRPLSGLIFDAAGNLYGTTEFGSSNFAGNVFELAPSGGDWTLTALHAFGTGFDGRYPLAGLVFDASGNLYGTSGYGGEFGKGIVFKLSPTSTGWAETILHTFGSGTDGAYPAGALVLDGAGNLYGTTSAGGLNGTGTVFEVTP